MSQDVVDLIMADHREVEKLFERMKADPTKRPMFVPVVATLLMAHSRAEEGEIYPVARDEAGIAEDVEHSQSEHALAEQILERLKATDHSSPEFDTILGELMEAVEHHVEEEEKTVLPGMKSNLSAKRLSELGEAFVTARREHMGDQAGEASKAELLTAAQNAGIEGASSMTAGELKKELDLRGAEEKSEL